MYFILVLFVYLCVFRLGREPDLRMRNHMAGCTKIA